MTVGDPDDQAADCPCCGAPLCGFDTTETVRLSEEDESYPIVCVHTWCVPLAQRHEFVLPPDIIRMAAGHVEPDSIRYLTKEEEKKVLKGQDPIKLLRLEERIKREEKRLKRNSGDE